MSPVRPLAYCSTSQAVLEYARQSTGVRSNETAGFIIECLEKDTTEAEIVAKMQKMYDGPKEAMERDVKKIIDQLRKIGAIDE